MAKWTKTAKQFLFHFYNFQFGFQFLFVCIDRKLTILRAIRRRSYK